LINITILKPENYIHSSAFHEIAEAFLFALRDIGFTVSLSTNYLSNNDLNIIFGANLISDAHVSKSIPSDSIIINLEQLTASDSPWHKTIYFDILKNFQVWDYSDKNIDYLNTLELKFDPQKFTLGFVSALNRIPSIADKDKDIDILFYGSINDRRKKILDELVNFGHNVKVLQGVYGAERDSYIARSKIILSLHYFSSQIFESVRAFYLMTNSKAVVAEVSSQTEIAPEYLAGIAGTSYDNLVQMCNELLSDPEKRYSLERSAQKSIRALNFIDNLRNIIMKQHIFSLPHKLNLGSGKDYKEGFLNVDISTQWSPDTIVDISSDIFNQDFFSDNFGRFKFKKNYFSEIICNDVLEHVQNLVLTMSNCLDLLKIDGHMYISVPYDLSYGAWQDPTHVRAFNEKSWLYYTDWYWYLGWTDSRFVLEDLQFSPSEVYHSLISTGFTREEAIRFPRAIDSMQVVLKKVLLSDSERQISLNYAQGVR
jgi:SAM-dependent methyltransferase